MTEPSESAHRVVGVSLQEGVLNSATAEHQKYGGHENTKFSSPFAFSAGGSELPSAGVAGTGAPAWPPAGSAQQGTAQQSTRPPFGSGNVVYSEVYTSGGPAGSSLQQTWVPGPSSQPPMQMPYAPAPHGYVQPPQAAYIQPAPVLIAGYGMPSTSGQVPQQSFPGQGPAIAMEGWLSKRSEDFGKSWVLRWFVLHSNGVMIYSKAQNGPECKRIILDNMTQVRLFNDTSATEEGRRAGIKKVCGFEIFQGQGRRTWYLDPGSPAKCELWMNALRDSLAQLQGPQAGHC